MWWTRAVGWFTNGQLYYFHIDEPLRIQVIQRMRTDKLTTVVKSDGVILKFGSMLLNKLGYRRALDISARMRELARIVIHLQTDNANERRLDSFFSGSNFDMTMTTVEHEGQPYIGPDGRRLFRKPAFVIKVGNSLLKCAHLKHGAALRENDMVSQKDSDDFIKLYSHEFTDRLASAAHASFRVNGNSLNEYPDEDNLRKLRAFQQDRMKVLKNSLSDEFAWRELAVITLCRVLIFNGRRGSEAAQLTLTDFDRVTNTVDPVLVDMLTEVE